MWAGQPPSGAVLRVLKDGVQLDSIPLSRAMTVFGRCEVLLHSSHIFSQMLLSESATKFC